MEYFLHILVLLAVYVTLSVSLDLLAGHTGLLSITHAAFYGLGAYTSALLTVRAGVPTHIGFIAGILVAAFASCLVSLPSLRLHDDYFVIATFSFQVIVYSVLNNWMGLTGGPVGIPAIPQPTFVGWQVDSHLEFAVLGVFMAVVAYLVVWRITNSPMGRTLHAIREDDVFAKVMGKSTLRFKVTAFAVSAAAAAGAGCLFAHYISYIDPGSFTVMESILVISMVIIGGAGSLWGPLVGAAVLVTLPEVLRAIGLPGALAANLRQILYGSLLIVMMMLRPQGLVGRYRFGH